MTDCPNTLSGQHWFKNGKCINCDAPEPPEPEPEPPPKVVQMIICARCNKVIGKGSLYREVTTPEGQKPVHIQCLGG